MQPARTLIAGIRPAWRGRRWWPAGLAWALWALAMIGLGTVLWFDHLLRRAGLPWLAHSAPSVPLGLALVSSTTVGAVLASRRSRHPVGWLLLTLGLSLSAEGVGDGYARYARPLSHPPPFDEAALAVSLACIGFVLLLTPTGSLPSPRWRWWARVAAAVPVVFLLAVALGPKPPALLYWRAPIPTPWAPNPVEIGGLGVVLLVVSRVAFAVIVLTVLVASGSLVVRLRRARGIERQQLRWVALAAVLASLAAVVALAGLEMQIPPDLPPVWAVGGCLAFLPLAIGAAILRYRLYDLDRIISRTVAYGLLTVLLGGGYALVVLGLGQLLGRDSSLVVAAATLAVAAVFQPARRRIQRAVDRRCNRRRYDAARTVDAFSVRLRDQVDLDTLTAELLAVVDQTMQPTQASLWLRPVPPPATSSAAGSAAT
jgi:N-terminal 7TM region of histidine kinase